MKDRIKEIMENENLNPTRFADKLQVNRAVISHILNGRNNPSLDVVMSILSEMPYINSDWLLNGIGNMYKDGVDVDNLPSKAGLFNKENEITAHSSSLVENDQPTELNIGTSASNFIGNKIVSQAMPIAKKISQIIIYYEDNTFETFIIDKSKK